MLLWCDQTWLDPDNTNLTTSLTTGSLQLLKLEMHFSASISVIIILELKANNDLDELV